MALETGNSPDVIFRNYRELVTEEAAEEWFGITPPEGRVPPEEGRKGRPKGSGTK